MKIAINGFGRVGRQVLKVFMQKYPQHQVVAINDLFDAATNAHLFKYDSNYGKYQGTVTHTDDSLTIDGKTIKVYAEKDPTKLPWKTLGVDLVVESTGVFVDPNQAHVHIEAGAKRVIVSAPFKEKKGMEPKMPADASITVVMGVNEKDYDPAKHLVISNASCTTNCLAPVVKVIDDAFGVTKGLMTTIHSYTNDQRILDLPHKDLRRARAAALNIIPTSTGAAQAVGLVLPKLKGKFNGFSLRVPTPTVSIVDFVCEVSKDILPAAELEGLKDKERNKKLAEAVNVKLKQAADGELKGILEYCDEELVSMDFKENPASSIVDARSTLAAVDKMIKVVAWYDNEWGYSCRVADLAHYMLSKEAPVKAGV